MPLSPQEQKIEEQTVNLLDEVLNLHKAGIKTQEHVKIVFDLLDKSEFPIEDLVQKIEVGQNAWLTKIAERFDFNKEGICTALNHMRLHNDYKTFYTFMAKLSLCPKELITSLLELPQFEKKPGHSQTQFEIFAKLIESPENIDPKLLHGSMGAIDAALVDKFQRHGFGLHSSNNLINYKEKKHCVDKCSDFFDWQVFNDEVLKKLEIGDDVSLSTVMHRFNLMVRSHPDEPTKKQFRVYDPNASHGDVICNSEEEVVAAIKAVLQRIYLLMNNQFLRVDLGVLRIRVYSNVISNHVTRFDKKAITDAAAKNNINLGIGNGMANLYYCLKRHNEQSDESLQKLETEIMQGNEMPEIKEQMKVHTTNKHRYNESIKNIKKIAYGFSRLYFAVRNGDDETVEYLLKNGADPDFCVINTLFEEDPVTKIRKERKLAISPLAEAAKHGYTNIVILLLNYRAKTLTEKGYNPLFEAARNNRCEVVRHLLEQRGNELFKYLIFAINLAKENNANETHEFLMKYAETALLRTMLSHGVTPVVLPGTPMTIPRDPSKELPTTAEIVPQHPPVPNHNKHQRPALNPPSFWQSKPEPAPKLPHESPETKRRRTLPALPQSQKPQYLPIWTSNHLEQLSKRLENGESVQDAVRKTKSTYKDNPGFFSDHSKSNLGKYSIWFEELKEQSSDLDMLQP